MSGLIEALACENIRLKSYATGSYKLKCPRCTPMKTNKSDESLSVTIKPDGAAVWNCHYQKCGWSGAVGRSTDENMRRPAASKPKKPSFQPNALPNNVVEWFGKRMITLSTLQRMDISWVETWMPSGKDWAIAFPYRRNHEIVNVKYRTLSKAFRQEKDAEKVFFNIDAVSQSKELYIVEGEIDALSLMECGINNVVSVPNGAQSSVKNGVIDPAEDVNFSYIWNCKDELAHIEKFILATDADDPGKALADELSRRFGRENCWRVDWPTINDSPRKDANEVLVWDGAEVLLECLHAARPWPIKSLHEVDEYHDEVFALFQHGRSRALSTGWNSLDQFMTVREGELTVVTGIPSHGKSEFIDALTINLAKANNWKFAICSFENPPDEHLSKLAEKYLGLPFWDGPRRRMSEVDLSDALKWLRDHFYFIRHGEDDSPTLEWIIETAAAAVMRYGVRGLIIDPWNEIEHNRSGNLSETEYVSQSLTRIRRFARQRGVHVWFVAHPAKLYRNQNTGETPVPSLYDISGSAHWANKADLGVVVYRIPESNPPKTEIHVRKCRFKSVGKIGMTTFEYQPSTGRYLEVVKENRGAAYWQE